MGNLLHYGLAIMLCLGGFHGVFFYENLVKKTAGWFAFQIGLIIFLIQLMPSGDPLPLSLAIETAAVTLAVTVLLGVLCLKVRRRYKTLEGDEMVRQASK